LKPVATNAATGFCSPQNEITLTLEFGTATTFLIFFCNPQAVVFSMDANHSARRAQRSLADVARGLVRHSSDEARVTSSAMEL
jgi:hypothetical protein